MSGNAGPGHSVLALFGIVALAALLRLPGLATDLWLDEIWTLAMIDQRTTAVFDVFTNIRHSNNHHLNTLYFYLLGDQQPFGSTEIIGILDRIRPPFNVNAPAIAGAIAALGDREHTDTARRHNEEIMPWFSAEVAGLGLTVNPSVANFVIVHFDPETPKNAEAAYQFLFSKGIVTRRVGGYGLPDWVRMSIGTREEMATVRDALKEFLEKND